MTLVDLCRALDSIWDEDTRADGMIDDIPAQVMGIVGGLVQTGLLLELP